MESHAHSRPAWWLARDSASALNPDFPLSLADARLELERQRASPIMPQRPIVVLSGWRALPFVSHSLARELNTHIGGPRDLYLPMSFWRHSRLTTMARRLVDRVQHHFPEDQPHRTREVDVVALSMGGIVARTAAALPLENGQRRLKIARLFTLGTPHSGAVLASRIAMDHAARDMKPGSPFLDRLNAGLNTARYELVCYARLNDTWVGARRCAPPGREPHWVEGPRLFSHLTISSDPRLIADIARRLRGESPLAQRPSHPPRD